MRRNAVELHHHHADGRSTFWDLISDAEKLLHAEAVRGLIEEWGEVVHASHIGDALGPGAVLHVFLDAGVQVTDATTSLCDCLAIEFENQAKNTMRRRVLRTHVDDDSLLLAFTRRLDGIPVSTRHGVNSALGGVVRGCVRIRIFVGESHLFGHQAYLLRSSGGGTVAPL